MNRYLLAFAALSSFVLVSCSDDDSSSAPSSVTKTIGPEGGSVDVGGATVTFAQGAVALPMKVTITTTNQAAPDGYVALSPVFHCEPSGTEFAGDVTMSMPFNNNGKPVTMFWRSGSAGGFKDVGGAADGNRIKATVRHFSDGFVGYKK
jgi:hypothetical protein